MLFDSKEFRFRATLYMLGSRTPSSSSVIVYNVINTCSALITMC